MIVVVGLQQAIPKLLQNGSVVCVHSFEVGLPLLVAYDIQSHNQASASGSVDTVQKNSLALLVIRRTREFR